MAMTPWFVSGPAAWLAAAGLWRGPERIEPTPAEDWRDARIDLVIAACRDQATIVHCLAGLAAQTLRPRRVLLVDDGGAERDHGIQLAREFAIANGLALTVVQRTWSIGKAATLKRQARGFAGDVLFVLDGDTVLASPDYIERCVRELYQGVGIASACGTVEPLRPRHRRALAASPAFQRWLAGDDYRDPLQPRDVIDRIAAAIADGYTAHVDRLRQALLGRGLMNLHGGTGEPSGGAIAYRRRYLKDLFDRYEPVRGDDLTAADDLFIARALAMEGYRSIRLDDVVARVRTPPLHQLPRQAWRRAVALMQNDHYFDPLLRSPLSALRHRWRRLYDPVVTPVAGSAGDRRRVREAYRQPFGERLTHRQGRPLGRGLLLLALERAGYPVALLAAGLVCGWGAAGVLVAAEAAATAL
ncbi:hypothetical protein N799_11565, partial [Lysobacter arseniciresistens ZS79]